MHSKFNALIEKERSGISKHTKAKTIFLGTKLHDGNNMKLPVPFHVIIYGIMYVYANNQIIYM